MNCEICRDKGKDSVAHHSYVYKPNRVGERFHFYCEEHFLMFCKMVVDEQ